MPAMYEVEYLPEGRKEGFPGSRGNYYELPDGSRIDVLTVPAWCHGCGKVTHGERVEPVAAIDQELADLDDPQSELYQYARTPLLPGMTAASREAFRLERIASAGKRRLWRLGRSSPPRCIHCGSMDLVMLPLDRAVPNPAAPGTITVRLTGMCSTDFNQWWFTPDGERIPRDTKPTYWHHPILDGTPEGRSAFQRLMSRLRGGGAGGRGEDDRTG